jgi:hypothetical protein
MGRIVAYYAVAAVAVLVLLRYVPIVGEAVSGGTLGSGVEGVEAIFGPDTPPAVGTPLAPGSPWHEATLAMLSMLGALALMIPVTWVYMATRRHKGHDESVVHTLLILPVAVTGIVMVVKSSLPLAFSLAGIVAAVRFRTTLEDTKDAVYVFLAIGVGLASGIQALGVAAAISIVFNVVVLVLWRTRFGDEGAPAASADATLAGTSAGLERIISDDRMKKKEKRANSLVLVDAKAAEGAQAYVDQLLAERAAQWKLAEIGPGPSGVRLTYLARLEGDGAAGAIMDRLRGGAGGVVEAAELRSLKGIKPRA